jgi:hypothetical protein
MRTLDRTMNNAPGQLGAFFFMLSHTGPAC